MNHWVPRAIVCLLIAMTGWSCNEPASPPSPAATDVHKTKRALITLSDIRSESPKVQLTAVNNRKSRPLSMGDALRIGDTVSTPKGVEAELRFDGGTLALLHEESSVEAGSAPELFLLSGGVTISRKLGSAVPFVVRIEQQELSIIHGKTGIQMSNGQAAVKVFSGELLYVNKNQYLATGETLSLSASGANAAGQADAVTPGKTQPVKAPTVQTDWSPSIVPLKTAEVVLPGDSLRRGIGTLTARNPRTNQTAQQAMKMNSHQVQVSIQDGVAVTRVEESFTNQSRVTVEATYRFLVPADALVTRLALDVNGRIEEGEVLEKKRAAKIFKQIVDDAVRPRDPALLEWEQGAAFKMKIFPIKPGETRRVFLTYTTPLTYDSGYLKYEYPLAGPGGAAEVDRFSIDAQIYSTLPIRAVRTPLFNAHTEQTDTTARIFYAATRVAPQHNFVVTVETDGSMAPLRSLVQTEKNGESFGAFLITPPKDESRPRVARRVIAVVDTSYHTQKTMIELAAATLVELLGGLGHQDRFNVLSCNADCTSLYDDFQEPGAARIIDVYKKIRAVEPAGASNLLGNLQRTFWMAQRNEPVTVVYLGDGIATSGELNSARLIELLSQTRPENVTVHTIGIGPDIDAPLLRRMARHLGGANYNLSFGESPGSAAWQLSKLFGDDALTDVSIEARYENGSAISLFPSRIGFWPGQKTLSAYAKLDALPQQGSVAADVHITATHTDGRPFEKNFRVSLQASNPAPGFISRLWAGDKIEALQFADGPSSEIIELSRKYRVASRLTSWIVLENDRMYDIFNVQRTDGEQFDGNRVQYTDAEGDITDEDDLEAEDSNEDALYSAMPAALHSPSRRGAGADAAGKKSVARAKPAKSAASSRQAADPLFAMDDLNEKMESRTEESAVYTSGAIAPARRGTDCSGPRFTVEIFSVSDTASTAAMNKAAALQAELTAHPLSRSLHRRYVRQLAKMPNRTEALAAADQWRSTDPYSTEALRAFAAEVARSGHRSRAVGFYDAQSEINPSDAKTHRRLARMHQALGNPTAAAGHLKAVLSLSAKPESTDVEEYLFQLVLSGQHALFQVESAQFLSLSSTGKKLQQTISALLQSIHTGIVPEQKTQLQKGALSVTVHSNIDVDVYLIDPYGRISSGLWRFGADASDVGSASAEHFYAQASLAGVYKVGLARADATSTEPAMGNVTIRLKGKQKTVPFNMTGNDHILSKIDYRRLPDKRCYAIW